MPNDVDKSLLDRLQALRGPSPNVTPERAAPVKISIDVIERSTATPTREDALAARLKSLRVQDEASSSSTRKNAATLSTPSISSLAQAPETPSRGESRGLDDGGDGDVDAMFQTDDQTLEELLGEAGQDENAAHEPSDEQVKALLETLSRSIPQDTIAEKDGPNDDDGKAGDSDDSDGEHMQREADDVIARLRDEAELETALGRDNESDSQQKDRDQDAEDQAPDSDLVLPSLPSNLDDLPSTSSPSQRRVSTASVDIDDITARMAALRNPQNDDDALLPPTIDFPSVPSSKPFSAGKSINRLTSRTNYTDDDVDGWCTVCLEDATLQCLGCDDDVYCARCWREMHIGPAAAFDDRCHRAVQFTKARKKEKQQRVALGA